jgi:hypothetical protein
MSKNNNPYEQSIFSTIERAILAEDVKFTKIKNLIGKFYIKVMTPTVDTTNVTLRSAKNITNKNYITLVIPAYMLLPFMKPTIETITYMKSEKASAKKTIMSFKTTTFTIPKGTKFLVEALGGEVEADKFHIIGLELSLEDYNKQELEEAKSK